MSPKTSGYSCYYYLYFINEESEVQVDFDMLVWFRFKLLRYLRHYVPVEMNVYEDFKNWFNSQKEKEKWKRNQNTVFQDFKKMSISLSIDWYLFLSKRGSLVWGYFFFGFPFPCVLTFCCCYNYYFYLTHTLFSLMDMPTQD